MPYIGGFDIVDIQWAGRNCVAVTVQHSGIYDAHLFQLYVGRQLVGTTSLPGEITVLGPVPAGQSACPLGIVVVEPLDRYRNFGPHLDLRPFNEYRLSWPAPEAPPADLHHFEIVAGSAPGAAYDVTNVVAKVPFQSGRPVYEYVLPTFPVRGDWSIAVIARDDAQPAGNAGAETEIVIPTIIYPLDFVPLYGRNGLRRFSTSVAGGVLSIGYTDATVAAFP